MYCVAFWFTRVADSFKGVLLETIVDMNLGKPKKGSKTSLRPTNGSIADWNIIGLSEQDLRKNYKKNVRSCEKTLKGMRIKKGMFRPWNPTKAKIKRWLKKKEFEFSQKHNRNPKLTLRKYLDKYVFSDLHEVFFCDFPHVLQEWILRLKENHPTNRIK
jgi:hypothetical protein